jgi:hypothetical protein
MERWKWAREGLPNDAILGYKNDKGAFVPIEQPNFDKYDDEWDDFIVPSTRRRIRVTDDGRAFLLSALRASSLDLRDTLGDRVKHLFEIGFYDTPIREACVQLEHEIKAYTRSDALSLSVMTSFTTCGRLMRQRPMLSYFVSRDCAQRSRRALVGALCRVRRRHEEAEIETIGCFTDPNWHEVISPDGCDA